MKPSVEPEPGHLTFKMHPRVLTALGRELVTNDIVAVIELVKNSYDAYATRVDVRFGQTPEGRGSLEIRDDGHGMDRRTLEEVWCVVATPFRKANPEAKRGRHSRLVTGDKGLGRLSAARLGKKLEMVSKAAGGPYLKVALDWDELSSTTDLRLSQFEIVEESSDREIGKQGTRLVISEFRTEWTEDRVSELRANLARLVSPFSIEKDFKIFLTTPGEGDGSGVVEVDSPDFLSKPKYAVRGHVDADGHVRCRYSYKPIASGEPRQKSLDATWPQIFDSLEKEQRSNLESDSPACGPFEFEIRAWDLTSDDTLEISQRFDIAKTNIRKAIGAHKGISVYRDEILVLPKSEEARDWLGLDLRRVSRIGTRLSTSQIVGYVRITKENNPRIEDTSDRERLASNPAVLSFQHILKTIVALLEIERDQDRRQPEEEERIVDLFEELTADELLAEMVELAEQEAPVAEALPILREFNDKLDRIRSAIRTRFIYYSRLATVGTIAQMLIHEIRNRTTAISRVLRKLKGRMEVQGDASLEQQFLSAEQAISSLEQLADRFSPLASRSYRRGKRVSVLEESISRSLGMSEGEIEKVGVKVSRLPHTETRVAIDPGELDSILINLISNSIYWLGHTDGEHQIQFRFSRIDSGSRVRVSVDDSGPGIPEVDAERVFWPGVTRKPGGIGMGLTVASELVAEHGGTMAVVVPGRLGGATFQFDLPLAK